jgi:hypothetical protein
MIQNRTYFKVAFPGVPEPVVDVWRSLVAFLKQRKCLPARFEVPPSVAGIEGWHADTARIRISPEEIEEVLKQQNQDFWVDTGHSDRSVGYYFRRGKESGSQSVLSCRIEQKAKAPDDWAGLIEGLMTLWPTIGAWQWRSLYQVWQRAKEVHKSYESRFGPLPSGYVKSYGKVESLTPQPDRVFVDISKNPGRPKELLPMVSFYPTAEMWLGPPFWQHARCTKEEVLAADFFLEKRDTPHFLYLKSWPEPFTRPDGEQGRQQQRLWKLFFHEDCEWPPGSGGISDEPMYGPPELMPGYHPR